LIHDNGAYTPWGIVLPWISATTVPGPYIVPAFRIDLVSVLTNKVPCTPVRGAGRPQAVVVMERLMDRVARELDLDPAEVRRRNFIQPEQMPYDVGIVFRDGRVITYDSGDYPACQESALKAVDYENFKTRQKVARAQGRYIGIGVSNAVEGTGLGPYEGATVRIGTNGKIIVYTGAAPQGQSHKTTLAQIAADPFDTNIDDILVETADTGGISLGIGSFAARTAVNAGSSVHIAALKVAEKVKLVASEMLQAPPDALEIKDGRVYIPGPNGASRSLKEVAVRSIGMPGFSMPNGREPGLEHTAYFTPDASTFANGTAVAEVEVDIETGRVSVTRLVLAHDCGRVINPMVVDGQVVGGAIHGVGNALYERLVHDADGQPLTTNFGEYLLPLAADSPRVEIIHHVSPSPRNPLRIKGAGEGGTIPTTAAVLSAIENALSPFDVRIREAPISPERIVALLGEAALGRTA
jgi:carbon-monoxide dehydrogenase large subunit